LSVAKKVSIWAVFMAISLSRCLGDPPYGVNMPSLFKT